MTLCSGDVVKTKLELKSAQEEALIWPVGTEGRVVLTLGDDAVLVELKRYDPRFEGDALFETIELLNSEVEKISSVELALRKDAK
jgi:hypothetical protein